MATDPGQLLLQIANAPGLAAQSVFDGANNALGYRQGQQQLQANDQAMEFNRMKMAAAQREQDQAQQYQTDLTDYFRDPKPERLAQLAAKYPAQADAIKQSYAMMDTAQRSSRQGQFGSLLNAATNNRVDLVQNLLTQIRTAEAAKGIDTSEVDDALIHLKSDPKTALKNVVGFAQMHLAAIDPVKFSETYAALGKGREGYTLGPGETRFGPDNERVASVAPKPEYLVVPEGGKAVPINGAPPLAEGGGPASDGAGGSVGSGAPRSVRNNNPGNLRVSPFTKKLPGYQGEDGAGYAIFDSPASGQNAQAALIRSYMGRGFNTVAKIVGRWAPPASQGGDNTDAQTRNYTAYVARKLNVNPNDTLTPVVADRLAQAMSEFESGHTGHAGAVRMGAGQAARSGDPAGTIYGNPKSVARTLTSREAQAKGLDPSKVYEQRPDGSVSAVGDALAGADSLPGDPNLSGQAYLASLPKGMQPTVRAIVEGRFPITAKMTSPNVIKLFEAANRVDPTVDATTYARRVATQRDFASSGRSGQALASARTIINHLYHLAEASEKIGGVNWRPANALGNWWKGETSDPNLQSYLGTLTPLSNELPKFLGGKAPTIHEISQTREDFSPNKGPDARRSQIATTLDLMRGRFDPIVQSYAQGMNKSADISQLIGTVAGDPVAAAKLRALQDYAAGGSLRPVAAPRAAPVRVRSIQEASRLPKGTVYVTPQGRVIKR